MNKTVNINLAGIFFHIDEDAYLKLQRYLEAIKRSFTDSQGRSEIIADIEARIAELFSERVQNDKQVIRIKEVDEVISIMGQPEDYLVDDEIFEDEPKTSYSKKSTSSSASKKLFRDTDNSYIGGVSSGLAHYFGIDTIWIRLAWILLIFGAGTGILLYILLWILVPEAKTTAEKIMMTGDPVNITNIEKKIKDGFDNVSDVAKNVTDSVGSAAKNVTDSVSNAAKNIDFQKQSNKIKSSSKTFFDTVGEIFMFFLKVFAKFIGIILIIVGASALIGLIIGLFSLGVADIIHIPGLDMVEIANAGNTPIWLVSLLSFFAIGIPFFFLFYLGLKILINNLKSIGNIAKFTLLGLWLISLISLIVVGIRQASEFAYDESYIVKTELPITATDTLTIRMVSNDNFSNNFYRNNHGFKLAHDDDGNKIIYSSDVDIRVKSTTDSIATISIEKSADGRSYEIARERAKNINYNFNLRDNILLLDSYLTTNLENKFSDQEVDVVLYIPENTIVYFNNSTKDYLHYKQFEGNIISREDTNHYVKILFDDAECLDCPEEDFEVKVNTPGLKINEEGVEINSDEGNIKIDNKGLKVQSEDVKVNIDSNGINIESDN
ncbi:Phage shock protein PspC (stress-responsive transcriptional regulator) [Flaviramulus basaltis]|uniref:Phage shock protein PspC (Stress-responsive transcriptional regulator) n=1 Tax=Flaviramulus basaltis TaxID=369401 RepID=A0A1K2IL31_9FLAO|nr:PspC domain-containing protein [Flaviramulus basaltis]SFZ93014.1 Phage shock protein PspC (stress-responsive transcriptional regulator) [Flaviramulus basaltis]